MSSSERPLIPPYALSAGLDGRHSLGGLGAANLLPANPAGGDQLGDVASELSRFDEGLQVCARACCGGEVLMTFNHGRVDRVLGSSPGKGQGGAFQLFGGDDFFVEIAFAQNEEMASGVVLGGGVAFDVWIA